MHTATAKAKRLRDFFTLAFQLKRVCSQVQTGQTEKTMKEEFQKLHRFLQAEETNRIKALRKEEAEKNKLMKDKIAKLVSDIATVTQKITHVEKELRAEDVPFMQVLHFHFCFIELLLWF